ncbi:MAG: nucleoside triphosphate pyrophosphohydrolase [Ruminococcaceae bacterium]|nr:nucleoside triphosphate pyrophosphohydrolase [Oscillospiraceae bacterium]
MLNVERFKRKEKYFFDDLVEIMAILRSENGCPWDKEQDHHSIRNNFIEEVYEAVEAIDTDNVELLKEELGDVMLQVVFHSRMSQEENKFNIDDVCDGVCKKLILRHPHIFADAKAGNSQEVLMRWDEIKKVEKSQKSVTDTLNSVSKALPSLIRSQKVQKRAAKVGFDWENTDGALNKLHEEIQELENAIKKNNKEEINEELGDLLFSCVNVARFVDCDAENSLYNACDKFISRFEKLENQAIKEGKNLSEMSLAEMDKLWDKIKLENK